MKYINIMLCALLLSSCASTVSTCDNINGCTVNRGDTATGLLNAIGNIVPSFIK